VKRKTLMMAVLVVAFVFVVALAIQAQAPTSPRPEPFSRYKFLVEIDGIVQASFLEVEGLNVTVDVVEYREGGDANTPILIPGLPHFGPMILRNGVTANNELLEWMEKTVDGAVERKNLSVVILDADGEEVARFNVWSAWPSKWSLSKLDSLGVGSVVEELVIQYEGFERVGYDG
jgi:phage tail-like protein